MRGERGAGEGEEDKSETVCEYRRSFPSVVPVADLITDKLHTDTRT